MKSLMAFYSELLLECGSRCRTSTSLDWKTIQTRSKDEGLPFLTITLPRFGKDLLVGLDQGKVDRRLFTGFQWKGGLPRFLGGFLGLIFDRDTGMLLDNPDIEAISSVLQLTLVAEKINLECSAGRTRKAFAQFVECENDVIEFERSVSVNDLAEFGRVSDLLWRELFSDVDEDIYYGRILPKHGPGATADRVSGNAKYRQTVWPARLESVFPAREYLIPNDVSFFSELDHVSIIEPGAETPMRVVSVPKTQKTPRIIAMEPLSNQYVQQGILERLCEGIEGNDILRSLVGFMDQSPNQIMAHEGSLSGELATLDLSEASDRVSCLLVAVMLRNHPNLAKGVAACRSRRADVPGFGVIPLAKFAPMGSALCFPFESMVFMTCIFLGISKVLNIPVSKRLIKSYLGKVRTYGDDIIVPVGCVRSVVATLELFGFKVNASKSFWTGKFRESCGKWFYEGVEVTPIRLREFLPSHRKHVPEVVSTVSLRNQLYRAGYWRTVRWLDERIEKIIPFPPLAETSSGLGRNSFLGDTFGYTGDRWDRNLHRPLVKAMVVKAEIPDSHLDGPPALLKWFLKRGEEPFADRNHLERAGRPRSVDIRARLVCPY